MPKTKQTPSREIVVDLKELEWVKILEVSITLLSIVLLFVRFFSSVDFHEME